MPEIYDKFHVGVNVFVVRDNKLLLGKRKNVYGAGTWGLPSGHLQAGEDMITAATRELEEETGLGASKLEFVNLVNDRSSTDHRLQVGFIAREVSGDLVVSEPEKCESWEWFDQAHLPENLFTPHKEQIRLFTEGFKFSDDE